MSLRAILALCAIGLAVCLVFASAELRTTGGVLGLPLDDSFIHLQFARRLAEGVGLAYQGTAWVSGSTGPLWTALLSLGFLLPLDPTGWAKALGVAAHLAALPAFFALVRAYGVDRPLAFAATALLALTDALAWSSLSGMEISLFVLLSTCGLLLHERECRAGPRATCFAVPVLALATLARPEGLLLLVLALAERALAAVRTTRDARGGALGTLVLAALAAALVLLPAGIFSWVAGGSLAPATLEAKTGGVHKLVPALRDYWRAAEVLFRPQPWAFFFAGGGLARLVAARWAAPVGRGPSPLPALWLLALPGAYSMLAPASQAAPLGNFGRYVFPLFPSLVLLAAVGLAGPCTEVARALAARRAGRATLAVAVALVVVVPTARALFGGAARYARNVANVEESDVAAGKWIAERLPPTAVLAVQDIGAIAYHAPNPLLDLVGIVDAPAVQAIRDGGLPGLIDLVRRRGAEYLVVFPVSYGGAEHLERLLPGLVPVRRFPVRRNITMAGPELVVFRLPREPPVAP